VTKKKKNQDGNELLDVGPAGGKKSQGLQKKKRKRDCQRIDLLNTTLRFYTREIGGEGRKRKQEIANGTL